MANIQALEYGVQNKTAPNKPTNLFLSNVNKENGAMDIYQLPLGPRGPRTLVMTSSSSNGWKPTLSEEGKKLDPEYQKFLLTDVSKEADNQRAAYINKNFTKVQKETLFKGAPKVNNLAAPSEAAEQSDSQTGEQQGNTSASEFSQEKLNATISDAGVREKYDNYRYPINAKFENQDCIKFSMFRYAPKKFGITENLGGFNGSNKGSPMGSVTLPIQPGISDSNVVEWGPNTMNSLQALAGAAALAGIQKGGEGLGESLEQISTGLQDKGKSGDIKAGLAAYFAGEAAGANTGFLTRATGAVLNNNLELLFAGPSLRSFTFNFSLSARETAEAEMIRKIIRLFKQGMSVKRSSSALFLKTPNIFDIQYLHKGKPHPYINQIKTCALQNFVVNYTPAGNYATYEDGAMTQYDITLMFGEIEPLFDDDYTKLDGDADTTIGY